MSEDSRRGSFVSVLALTAVLSIPFWGFDYHALTTVFENPQWRLKVPVIATVAVVALIPFELVSLYLVAWVLERGLNRLLRRPWSQIHLQTALLLMLGCSAVVLAILPDYLLREDVPIDKRLSRLCRDEKFLGSLFVGVAALGATAVFFEQVMRYTARRREESAAQTGTEAIVSEQPPATDAAVRPPPDDSTLSALAPTFRECLLGAVPMFLLFGLMIVAVPLVDDVRYAMMRERCNIPDLALGAFAWHHLVVNYPSVCALIMVSMWTLYFGWVAKERRRIVVFNIAVYALLWIGALGLLLGLVLPFLGYSSCVAEGAEIDTPNGKRRIDDLQVGDEVTSVAATGELLRSRITAKRGARVHNFLSLRFDGNAELRVTDTHPIALEKEWRRAGELKAGDVARRAGGLVKIVSIEKKRAAVIVYDLSVEPHRNFLADGVLVHNALKKK
jgi:hypothetical protein